MPSPVDCRALPFVVAAFALGAGCDGSHPSSLDSGVSEDGGTDAALPTDGGEDASDAATTVTVEGIVVDQLSGLAVGGASVFVADRSGVVSDASGRFTAIGVTPPYDVAVRASGTTKVRVFQGLTTNAPSLAVDTDATERTANVSGHAIFSVATSGSDRLTCFLTGPRLLGGFTRVTGPSDSPAAWNMSGGGLYDFPARWWGAPSIDGVTHCFLDELTGDAVSASFHGSLPLTLASGGSFANVEVMLAPTPLATVSGTVLDPLSATSLTLAVGPAFADASGYYASSGPQAAGAFSRVVPYVPGAFVLASAYDNLGSRLSTALVPASETISIDLALLAPPTLTAPVSGASGVAADAPMTWEGGDGHVFRAYLGTTDGTSVEVLTAAKSVVPPNLARFGLAYPPGGNARALVVEYSASSVDSLATGTELVRWMVGRRTAARADSGMHAFTFAN